MNKERRHYCPIVVVFCWCALFLSRVYKKGEIKQKKRGRRGRRGEGEVLLLSSLMVSFGCCCYPEGCEANKGFEERSKGEGGERGGG